VLWALCDDTIDAYFPILDRLGTRSTALETKSSTGPTGVSWRDCSSSSAP